MATNQKRRQKRLERKNAKRKSERKMLARRKQGGLAAELTRVAAAPVLHCCVMKAIWGEGIGQVMLSRRLNNGQVAFANFLVDVFCLGVKNVYADILPESTYMSNVFGKTREQFPMEDVSPAHARKLVEDAVAYAASLDLRPHPDYRAARQIFGDVDPNECPEEFTFGKDGKPLYVPGPHDSQERSRQIVSILRNVRGPDGFDYIITAWPDDLWFEEEPGLGHDRPAMEYDDEES